MNKTNTNALTIIKALKINNEYFSPPSIPNNE